MSLTPSEREVAQALFAGLDHAAAAQVILGKFPKGPALAMLMLLRDRVGFLDRGLADVLEATKTEAAVPANPAAARTSRTKYFISARNEEGNGFIAEEIDADTFEDAFAILREMAIGKWPGQFWRPTSVVEVPKLEVSGPLALAMLIGKVPES